MKKQYVLVGLLLVLPFGGVVASGCQGGDPNENSATVCDLNPSFAATAATCTLLAQASSSSGGSSSGSGGSSGSNSSSGSSGGGGDGGGNSPIVGCPLATFDTNAGGGQEGISINAYHDTGTTTNLADPTQMFPMQPTIAWDGTIGNPSPGSLTVVVPYTGANQYVDLQNAALFGTAHPQDWTGAKMHVRVKADGSFVGGVQPYVITTSGYVFGGSHTNFTSGVPVGNSWRDFTVNVSSPVTSNAGYDPKQVIIFGLQLTSDQAGASQRTATFHIDSISVEGLATCPTPAGPPADAGASDTGASDAGDAGAPASDSGAAVDAADAE
jgi:hypothetical protein